MDQGIRQPKSYDNNIICIFYIYILSKNILFVNGLDYLTNDNLCLFYDNVLIVIFRKCPNINYHGIISVGGIYHGESRVKSNGTNKIQNNKTTIFGEYPFLTSIYTTNYKNISPGAHCKEVRGVLSLIIYYES